MSGRINRFLIGAGLIGLLAMGRGLHAQASVPPSATTRPAAPNLLDNGDFERLRKDKPWPAGWQFGFAPAGAEGCAWTIDEKVSFSGKQSFSVKVVGEKVNAVLNSPTFPIVKGRKYRLDLHVKFASGAFSVRKNIHNADGKMVPEQFATLINVRDAADWTPLTAEFTASGPGTRASFSFFLAGPGTLWIDAVHVSEVAADAQSSILFKLTPNGWVDNDTVYLSQNDPIELFLTPINPAGHVPREPRLVIEAPPAVGVVGTDYASGLLQKESVVRDGALYQRHVYSMGQSQLTLKNPDDSRADRRSIPLVLRSSAAPGGPPMKVYCRYEDADVKGHDYAFSVVAIPSMRQATPPKTFRIGAHMETSVDLAGDVLTAVAAHYRKAGFNTVYLPDQLRPADSASRDVSAVVQAMKANGLETWCVTSRIVNGFEMPWAMVSEPIPDQVRITRADGKVVPNSFDPAYILAGGPLYREALDNAIRQFQRDGFDHIWSNWEPWRYRLGQGGIFTPATLKAFAAEIGASPETILSTPPAALIEKYRPQLQDFSARQHERVINNLVARLRELTVSAKQPVMFDFCTGEELLSDVQDYAGKPLEDYARCFHCTNWIKNVSAASGWYYLKFQGKLYGQNREFYEQGFRQRELSDKLEAISFSSLVPRIEKRVAWLKKTAGNDRLVYTHVAQGRQVNDWLVTPRELSLQMDSAFVGGADGVQLYFFPAGYDARYWNAVADTIDRITHFEDFIRQGRRDAAVVAVSPAPGPFATGALQSQLVYRAFAHQNKILVAIGNYDLTWPAFVTIVPQGDTASPWALLEPYEGVIHAAGDQRMLRTDVLATITHRIAPGSFRYFVFAPDAKDLPADLKPVDAVAASKALSAEMNAASERFDAWHAKYSALFHDARSPGH